MQRYNFQKISNEGVYNRLHTILEKESEEIDNISCQLNWEQDALEFIAKVSSGGMRDAITLLDKCLSLSNDLTLENVLSVLGGEDYGTFFELLDKLVISNPSSIEIIDEVYNAGKDVKQFMKDFAKFILEVEKYLIYGDSIYITIPQTSENMEYLNIPSDYIISDEEELRAYLRGVFLSVGSINDPKTSRYHLELALDNKEYANFINDILNSYYLNSRILK